MDEINWNDWLTREQITLDDCLLLAMGENPSEPDNDSDLWEIYRGDKYRELRTEAERWIDCRELKARKINKNGSEEVKNISPIEFFSLAMTKGWFLPESIHEWLEKREYQSRVTFVEVQPLEPLTGEQAEDYKKRAAWTFVEAIYILQGFNPVRQSSTEQVFRHFPNELVYFTESIELGVIGKERYRAGEKAYIDSPANWQAFWQKAKKDNLGPPVEIIGENLKKPDVSENKEFNRVITQWLYDFWIEKGHPETGVFFRMLKKTIGDKGSPIVRHWGAGSRDGGFHWDTGDNEGDMTYKRLGNIISGDFKKRVKRT